jgi:flagellar motor switch protein FliM
MADSSGRAAAGGTSRETADPNSRSLGGSSGAASGRHMEEHPAWPMISRLPMKLAVSIPLSGFRVRDLLRLACGQTIESAWPTTEDVPLKAGEIQVSWNEFEVVDQHIALRLTRLA